MPMVVSRGHSGTLRTQERRILDSMSVREIPAWFGCATAYRQGGQPEASAAHRRSRATLTRRFGVVPERWRP